MVPIGLSPLLILTLCGSERVLVASTEPPDDLSCLTTTLEVWTQFHRQDMPGAQCDLTRKALWEKLTVGARVNNAFHRLKVCAVLSFGESEPRFVPVLCCSSGCSDVWSGMEFCRGHMLHAADADC